MLSKKVFPGGTAGSVLFVGANQLIAQDNANLFFDDSANTLLVGVAVKVGTNPASAGALRLANADWVARQLEGIIGLLARENDCLRERIGTPASIRFFHRSFTSDDLEIGRSLVTSISGTPTGTVHVHLES